VIHATDLIAEVDAALDRLRNYRIGAAPQTAMAFAILILVSKHRVL
jgi:hypothetical protein